MIGGHWQPSRLATILLVTTACVQPLQPAAADGLAETGDAHAGNDDGAGDPPSEPGSATSGESGNGDDEPGDGDGDRGDGDPGDPGDGDGDPGDGDGETSCGNGIVDSGEECDLGIYNSDTGLCKTDCTNQVCGDGFMGPGEECDDGNPVVDDECSTLCENNLDVQCLKSYHVLDLADRNVDFNDGDDKVEWCDRTNSASVDSQWQGLGWYRLMGAAGTRLPVEPPSDHSCGTEAPGWMLTGHPSIIEGVVKRTSCFALDKNSCEWESTIEVVNCGEFYLYRLLNTKTCSLRYCGID
jgi:cysteine-rich repeat protein